MHRAASETPGGGRSARAILALTFLVLAWGTWFIFRTSFEVDGRRYFSLFDDAMISMAYARNLVEGYGLNWARYGAPVEGFTSPLWTLLMVPVNALPLPLTVRPALVQGLSLALVVGLLFAVRRLVRRHFAAGAATGAGEVDTASWLPACLLTALYYPLLYWSLMGMETALQALVATLAVHAALDVVDGRSPAILTLGALLSLAYLVRMDMLVAAAAIVGFLAASRAIRRADAGRWAIAGGMLLATIGGYQLFRLAYFGDPLPNTYYLKLTGVPLEMRLLRGLATYADFLQANLWAILLVAAVVAPFLGTDRKLRLPVILFAASSAYSIWVGGDAWEIKEGLRANRFVVWTLPLVFAAFAGGLDRLRAGWERRGGGRAPRAAAVAATVALVLLADGLVLSARSDENWDDLVGGRQPLLVVSHAVVLTDLLRLEEIVRPGAKVAVAWAGIPAYHSDYRMLDIYGYSDRHVARLPSAEKLTPPGQDRYTPGHVKWDYAYLFGKRPHAFLQAWQLGDRTEEVMGRHGYVQRGGFWTWHGRHWLQPDVAAAETAAE